MGAGIGVGAGVVIGVGKTAVECRYFVNLFNNKHLSAWHENCYLYVHEVFMPNCFEDFPVYKKTLEAIKDIEIICNQIKLFQFAFIKDQLRRASSSVLLNLAEGSIKWNKKDKTNFYRMSGASACECIAAIDLLEVYGLINNVKTDLMKQKFKEISENIQALIISIQKRP